MSLIGILVALIIICVLLWAIYKILGVAQIPEPIRTIIWVVAVVIAVLIFLEMSGLYAFNLHSSLR